MVTYDPVIGDLPWRSSGRTTAKAARVRAEEWDIAVREPVVSAPPGWAATASGPVAGSLRSSSYVNIRLASLECPYAAVRS